MQNTFIYSQEHNMQTHTKSLNRLALIRNQLKKKSPENFDKYKSLSTFCPEKLKKIYFPFDGQYEFRSKIFDMMKQLPEFKIQLYQTEMRSKEMKIHMANQMKVLIEAVSKIIPFKELREDPIKFAIFMECVNHYDLSIAVRFAFHSLLYYDSLKFLGKNEYHLEYAERSLTLEDVGCFALTEFGHGTNVRGIGTVAVYDEKTGEFVLNSPNVESYKWWIGGAGLTANMGVVFAQTYSRGECHGIQAFLVKIRDQPGVGGKPMPGVILGDTGPKVGNDAVDNGYIGFKNCRIPRKAMLNKFSEISEDGVFSSEISSPDVRFATAIGALSEGRVGVCMGTHTILINALTIAGRYSFIRKQFSNDLDGAGPENLIIDYPSTQVRIFPALAEAFAMRAAGMNLGLRWKSIIVKFIFF